MSRTPIHRVVTAQVDDNSVRLETVIHGSKVKVPVVIREQESVEKVWVACGHFLGLRKGD